MLQAAITFFFLGILVMVFSVFGVGLTMDLGEMIASIFFIFALMTFIGSAEIERKKHKDVHH